jgi:hypothetical protein
MVSTGGLLDPCKEFTEVFIEVVVPWEENSVELAVPFGACVGVVSGLDVDEMNGGAFSTYSRSSEV